MEGSTEIKSSEVEFEDNQIVGAVEPLPLSEEASQIGGKYWNSISKSLVLWTRKTSSIPSTVIHDAATTAYIRLVSLI